MLQNSPSTVAAVALGAEPGMRVLDMCAAPGGKTCAIACCMRDRGALYALDRTTDKARLVRDTAREQGHTCVTAIRKDATRLVRIPGAQRARAEISSEVAGAASELDAASVAGTLRRQRERARRAAHHKQRVPKDHARSQAAEADPLPGASLCVALTICALNRTTAVLTSRGARRPLSRRL